MSDLSRGDTVRGACLLLLLAFIVLLLVVNARAQGYAPPPNRDPQECYYEPHGPSGQLVHACYVRWKNLWVHTVISDPDDECGEAIERASQTRPSALMAAALCQVCGERRFCRGNHSGTVKRRHRHALAQPRRGFWAPDPNYQSDCFCGR